MVGGRRQLTGEAREARRSRRCIHLLRAAELSRGVDMSTQPPIPKDPVVAEPAEGERGLRMQIDGLKGFAIFMLDSTGRVATWNTGAQRFQGYEAEEIVGRDFACFFSPEDVEAEAPQRELLVAARDG